jgi:hypothetical protein
MPKGGNILLHLKEKNSHILVSIGYAESKRLIVLSLVCPDLLIDWNLMRRLIPK